MVGGLAILGLEAVMSQSNISDSTSTSFADATFQIFCSQISSDYLAIIKRDLIPQLKGHEGVNLRDLRTVMVVDFYTDPVTSAEIAHELRYDKGTASRTTQKLESMGLIQRFENEDDARSSVFELTESGQNLAIQYRALCEVHFSDFGEQAGVTLTEEERKVAMKLLLKLRERTRRMLEPPQRRYQKALIR